MTLALLMTMVLVSSRHAQVARLQPLVTMTTHATIDDGSCVYADDPCETCNPDGTVNPNDDDDDGVCNDDETEGCTDPAACNDGAYTDTDNSLCEYPD